MSLEPTNNVERMMRDIEANEKAARNNTRSPEAAVEGEKKEQKFYWILIGALAAAVLLIALLFDSLIMPAYVGSDDLLTVPDIVSTDTLDAMDELRKFNLNPVISERLNNKKIPAGQVISQTPHAGEKVKAGRPVYLVASRGPDHLEMPQVVGTPLREARIQLLRLGLQIGDIDYIHSERFDARVVISQSTTAGSKLSSGDKIDLVVSLGAEIQFVEVPDFIGKTLPEARQILDAAGLTLGFVNQSTEESPFVSGTIIDQFPAAGEQVEPGVVIHLTLAR